eukprot:GFUD01096491.1.p1 GENE.GFUD01096491.1~~GFUD01096491.1.p1  ORF type:complete len:133 (-),score=51.45 GFUD01096491.1:51-422(-)
MALPTPVLTPEEDEEKLVMRRLRTSVDELRRGMKKLDYTMQRVMTKAEQAKEQREKIELNEGKMCMAGEPTPFRAFIPQDLKKGGGRLIYKGCKLNNRSLHNYRPSYGEYVTTFDVCYATKVV